MENFQVVYEIYTGSWIDISQYVVGSPNVSYGLASNDELERVATIGQLTLILNNAEGKFSPNLVSCISGFKKGIKIRLKVIYHSIEFIKFTGHINFIDLDAGTFGNRKVRISAYDWFDYANNETITLPTIEYDKKINDGVSSLLNTMTHQPENVTYNTGVDVFPTIFDNTISNSRVVSEFQKLAQSELGYIYLRHTNGERLVVESRHTRNANSILTTIPVIKILSGHALAETGDSLLLEDGGFILLDQTITTFFDNNMNSCDIDYGSNLANKIVVRAYPRRIDTSTQNLFTLNSPISIQAGETKENMKVTYSDPNQLAVSVSGSGMISPIATTDYLFYEFSDGTGTNLTTSCSVIANFGANEAYITLINNSGTSGYLTKLNLRGKGIYTYQSIDFIEKDTTSINDYGYQELVIDQRYQDDPFASATVALVILTKDKEPRTILNQIDLLTSNDNLQNIFLYHDIGDLVYVKESQTGIDQSYYINGVSFQVLQGGLIRFSYLVKEAIGLGNTYWYLGVVGSSELGETTILGY